MTDKTFLSSIGAKIKEIRMTKNMSQTKLAEMCNIEKANLSRIESGQTNITVLTLVKISKALDTPAAEILSVIQDKIAA
jgi:transcriptional regulator with XRE-family HTH domain